MSANDAQLPETTSELQDIVRTQATQLAKLIAENEALLSKVEATEQTFKEALEVHLSTSTREKDHLESSLQNLKQNQQVRSEEFQKQLQKLRVEADSQINDDAKLRPSVAEALASTDINHVKHLVETLTDKLEAHDTLIKKLKFELDMECGHVNILRAENQKLRQMTVELQASAEQEEEYIANKLMKRINNLKKEKGELLLKVEQEEEMITNTLQKKLSQLQKEKIDMEVALEQEQEFIVNRLQKQLESLRMQQSAGGPPRKLSHTSHSPSASLSDFPVSPGVTEVLRAEVNALKTRIHTHDLEHIEVLKSIQTHYMQLRDEVVALRQKLSIPVDDIDRTYPAFVVPNPPPTRSPSAGNLVLGGSLGSSRSRSTSEHSVVGIDHGPGQGRYGGDRRSSRSVSSTRGSILSSTT
ncbi:uncharacterized protein EV422DRAFT_170436 [Fimicolochytrium jonesii]|uniref:uncharacterized protein n=1 Tax=Fimicolochytrium jonesii TaxID=1396493 RepID=UPI0022FE093A|nr:uncharacterized protein EV422DRAFT_170436 [Fimicolochytrium jonesii]KAI8818522.1 hypothetical protein EV422DRAFT_170436 [Fimicolochytrium jonesii]